MGLYRLSGVRDDCSGGSIRRGVLWPSCSQLYPGLDIPSVQSPIWCMSRQGGALCNAYPVSDVVLRSWAASTRHASSCEVSKARGVVRIYAPNLRTLRYFNHACDALKTGRVRRAHLANGETYIPARASTPQNWHLPRRTGLIHR